MPVEQAPSPPSRPAARQPDGAKLVRYHDYIDQKIETTRRMVKFVDLATAFVELAVVLLAFLLLYAVLEHWVVPGGFSFAVRCALFGVLVGGAGFFAHRRLWPLCARAINPVYAAQTIEHGSPSLKNGLINLLLFRQRRTEIPDAVYRTLEEQAAHGLTRVQVDSAVDQSKLIRLGYVLIAIVAIGALYKVLSPKDPFVAAERVLMPWAEIVPASRVAISAITPGATTISRGEFVDVAAEVRGLGEDDAVVLRYTTDDGQVVGRSIPMKAAAGRVQFSGRLADESDGPGSVGVTRSLSYRLEAGDARSLDYAITVVPAASILVERVEYDYPAYTGYVDRSIDGVGDIHAIEGTKVTVHARANGPIREANVDFNADGRRDLTMTAADLKARASFELALRDDRQTPKHASYVLRFTNDEGRANHDPVKHAINVERDFEPEADIRVPEEKSRDVRLDETVAIEVGARDPDFALSAVRLRGDAAGRVALDERLLKSEHRGQLTAKYQFMPSAHGLKAGDVLEYWVEASDNRTPKPNLTATERKALRIISPNPAQQPPPNQVAQNDRQQRPQQGEQQGEQSQGDKEQGRQGEQGGKAGEQQQGNEGGQGQAQQGQGQSAQGQQAQQNKGEGEQQGKESQPGGGNAKSRPDGVGKNAEGGKQGSKENQQGGQGQAGKQSKAGESRGDKKDPQKSDGEQTGAGAAGSESSKGAEQPAGTRPDENKGEKPSAINEQNGEQQPKQDEDKPPVSSEGDNDAEAFDRIQKHLEQKGELKKDEASPAEEKNGGESQDKSQQGQGEQRQRDKQQGSDEQKDDQGAEAGSKDGTQGADPKTAGKGQETSGEKQDNAKGAGAETRGDDLKNGEMPNAEQKGQQEKSPGGEQTASKGDPGAGEEKNSQGAPNSKPEMKPTEKPEQSPSKGDQSNQSEPPAGANSKKESDSQGEQGGDKAGGGEEGGGQKAPREGTGSAGQNQSADNGAGQSGEKGKGANSSEGGKDAKSTEKTGSSDGKTQGEGNQQRQGTGAKSGGKSGDKDAAREGQQKSNGEPKQDAEQGQGQGEKGDKEKGRQGDKEDGSKADNEAGKPGEKSDGKQQGADSGKDAAKGNENADSAAGGSGTEGGGKPGAVAEPSITGETPEGDAANLEYARQQTDLVVDKLADQLNKKKVDDKLLKDLGWSEAELRRFVERWQERRDAASKNDPSAEAAKQELDDALRSLGLERDKLQQGAVKKDTLRDLREGYHGPVPAEYKERLRAYNQGVSRARQDGK
jgi:hypothetical protein